MPVTVGIPFIFLPPPGVPPRRRRARLRFYVMNAIIAYLPSGDKKVIIPSAHRYFITSSPRACPESDYPYLLHRHQRAAS